MNNQVKDDENNKILGKHFIQNLLTEKLIKKIPQILYPERDKAFEASIV